MATISIQRFAKDCLREARAGHLTMLVGAGVSMLPPTQLPSALELKRMAVEGLCDFSGLRKFTRPALTATAFPSLVLEVLFQHLYDCLEDRLYPFFDVLTGAQPNRAHTIVAKFHEGFGVPVLTTNFDTLIEQEQRTNSQSVIHLHGDLAHREQMIVRIHQVGKGLSKSLAHNAGRLIHGRVLCVLGYSGTDEDVRALLRQYRPVRTYWLVREANGFAARNIEHSYAHLNVAITVGDLSSLVRMWNKGMRCKPRKSRSVMPAKNSCDIWRAMLTFEERCAGISELMFDLEKYRTAADVALLGYRNARTGKRASWFLAQAAGAHKILGETPMALKYTRAALVAAKGNLRDRAFALNAQGLAYLEQKKTNPARALPLLRRAAKSVSRAMQKRHPPATSEKMRKLAAMVFNNLGLCLMQLRKDAEAQRAFLKSIRLKEKGGDLIGISTTSANLARLNLRRKRYASAYKWKRRSLYLTERYDRKFTKAYLLRSMGALSCEQGRMQQGLRMLNEAFDLYQNLLRNGLGAQLTKQVIEKFGSRASAGK